MTSNLIFNTYGNLLIEHPLYLGETQENKQRPIFNQIVGMRISERSNASKCN